MAKELDSTLRFKADISDLKQKMHEMNTVIRGAQAEYKAASDGTKEWAKSTDGARAAAKQLTTVIDAQKQKLADMNARLREMEAAGDGSTKEADKLRNAISNLGYDIKRNEADLANYVKSLDKITPALKSIESGLNKMSDMAGKTVGALGDSLEKLGKSLSMKVTAPLTGLVGAAAKTSIEFVKLKESTMIVFDRMLGGAKAAEDLYGGLLGIAKASTYSQETFAKAGKALVGMGADADSTKKYLKAATDAVAAFGGSGQDIEELADVMGKALSKGKLQMNDFNSMSKRGVQGLAILGNHFGVSADEAQKMVSKGLVPAKEGLDILTDAMQNGIDGVNGFIAGTEGMAQAMKVGTLTGALDGLKSSFRNFSLELTSAFENKQPLIDLLLKIQEGLGHLPKLFGSVTDSIAPLLEFITRLIDKFVGVGNTIDEFRGKLAPYRDEITKNEEEIQKLTGKLNALEEAGVTAGDEVDSLRNQISFLTDVNRMNTEQMEEQRQKLIEQGDAGALAEQKFMSLGNAIMGMAVAGPVLVGVGGALDTVGGALSGVSAMSEKVHGAFGNMIDIAGKVGDGATFLKKNGLEGLTEGFKLTGDGVKSLGGIFTNVFGVAGIVGAVVVGLGALNEATGGKLEEMIQSFAESAPKMIDGFVSKMTEMLPKLIDSGLSMFGTLVDTVVAVLPGIVDGLVAIIPSLIEAGIKAITKLMTAMAELAPTLIPKIIDGILSLIPVLIQNLPLLLDAGVKLLLGILDGIVNALPTLIGFVPEIIEAMVTALIGALPQILAMAPQIIISIINGIMKALPELISMVPRIPLAILNGLKEGLPQFLDMGKALLSSMWDGVKNFLPNLLNGFADVGEKILGKIKGVFGMASPAKEFVEIGENTGTSMDKGLNKSMPDAVDSIGKFGDKMLEIGKNSSNKFIKTSSENFGKLSGLLEPSLSGTMKNVTKFGDDMVNKGKDSSNVFVRNASNTVSTLSGLIDPSLTKTVNNVSKFGADLISKGSNSSNEFVKKASDSVAKLAGSFKPLLDNTDNTVSGWGKALVQTGMNVATTFTDSITGKLGELAGKMLGIGKNIASSLSDGMSSMGGYVSEAVTGLANGAANAMKKALKISSPSKLFGGFGVNAGMSFGDSLFSSLDDVKKDLQKLNFDMPAVKQGVGGAGAADYRGGDRNVTINQYNTSPKALSRLELYRQTRNAAYIGSARLAGV